MDWYTPFRAALRHRGWTRKRLAAESSVRESTIDNWLDRDPHKRKEPTLTNAIKVANAMGMTLDEVFQGTPRDDEVDQILRDAGVRFRGLMRGESPGKGRGKASGA